MDFSVFLLVVGGFFATFLGFVLAAVGLDHLWSMLFSKTQVQAPPTLGEQVDHALRKSYFRGEEAGFSDGEIAGYNAGYSAGYGDGVSR